MQTVTPPLFTIGYLQSLVSPNGVWFRENSPHAMAGRCLLDSMEYLRADLTVPGQFRQLANAHAVRLVTVCLSDKSINRPERLKRMGRRINEVLQLLHSNRNTDPPFYGADYWDWSAILECFLEVNQHLPNSIITRPFLENEMDSFKQAIEATLGRGLLMHSEDEWYGPATAAAAHRVLGKWAALSDQNLHTTLNELKKQALQVISKDGKYRKHLVSSSLTLWHYGQVVGEFPTDSARQKKMIKNVDALPRLPAIAYRVYALARVIQGANGVGDNKTKAKAVELLYDCQNLSRPLGQGLLGDEVKGSLNVLEAIWPTLLSVEKNKIGSMVDALADAHSRANTVGVLVAIEPEFQAVREAFETDKATIEPVSDDRRLAVSHPEYRAVIRQGKAHVDTADATRRLLVEDEAKWLFMVGIAGSLGAAREVDPGSQVTPARPDLGDVVLAACIAPHDIRAKIRKVTENAPVPFRGLNWTIIPTNPALFASALKAASEVFPEDAKVMVHEGMIVTGHLTDSPSGKADLVAELPGGLAIEEEGYIFALLCLNEEKPYMVIRGISDFAGGDKKKDGNEEARKKEAAEHAAKVAVAAIRILSRRW